MFLLIVLYFNTVLDERLEIRKNNHKITFNFSLLGMMLKLGA